MVLPGFKLWYNGEAAMGLLQLKGWASEVVWHTESSNFQSKARKKESIQEATRPVKHLNQQHSQVLTLLVILVFFLFYFIYYFIVQCIDLAWLLLIELLGS